MKIFLLSKIEKLNQDLKDAIKREISNTKSNRIAYISSARQEADNRNYYLQTTLEFKNINNELEVDYFDLSENFTDTDLDFIKNYKIVFLSGGNTFSFLRDAQNRNLKNVLEKILENNGVIIGISAGGIMMTENIEIAEIESLGDENTVNLKNLSSFNFVENVEFYPHYEEKDSELLANRNKNIIACQDGSGFFINEKEITKFGETKEFKIQ